MIEWRLRIAASLDPVAGHRPAPPVAASVTSVASVLKRFDLLVFAS